MLSASPPQPALQREEGNKDSMHKPWSGYRGAGADLVMALPLTCCVTLNELRNFSRPFFPHL